MWLKKLSDEWIALNKYLSCVIIKSNTGGNNVIN